MIIAADADEIPAGHHLHPPRAHQRHPQVHIVPNRLPGRPLGGQVHQGHLNHISHHGEWGRLSNKNSIKEYLNINDLFLN
jgi:hypothetical protein